MSSFLDDILNGLQAEPKRLPSKYFYDEAGSALFEQITALPEYYPTRVELALLQTIAPELSAGIPPGAALIEFGSGSSLKTRLLLEAAPQLAVYAPLDISPEPLQAASDAIGRDFPALIVDPIVGDFTKPFSLPESARGRPCVGFFPGSTIGNFTPDQATVFLRGARASLGEGAQFIIGYDMAKDRATLEAAYNDAQGVTAAFNLNLLRRLNRELGADFDLDGFQHKAVWNQPLSRIEMHLVSQRAQAVHIGGEDITFAPGESIRTELSHKYFEESFAALAADGGWRVQARWISPAPRFGVVLLGTA